MLGIAAGKATPIAQRIAALFANNEQGVWYDPSDFSTMFQDSAGLTPVTALNQSLGLILDKHSGLVRGPDVVVNGDFNSGSTGWTITGTDATHIVTFSGGTMRYQSDTTTPALTLLQTAILTTGRTYEVTLVVTAYGGGNMKSDNLGVPVQGGFGITGVGTFKAIGTATSSNMNFARTTANTDITFESISVREIPGNHSIQATVANRPLITAKVNLVSQDSEYFNTTFWTKTASSVTIGFGPVPSGPAEAFKLIEDTSTGTHALLNANTASGSRAIGTYTCSVFAKAAERSRISLYQSQTETFGGTFDLSNGTVVNQLAGTTCAISSAGSGWYRCSITFVTTTAHNLGLTAYLIDTGTNQSYTGNGTSGAYFAGFQIDTGSIATRYQSVGSKNLLIKTEQFSDSFWSKSGAGVGSTPALTSNFAVAPDGTMTADRLVFALNDGITSTDQSMIVSLPVTTTVLPYAGSVYVKATDESQVGKIIVFRSTGAVAYTTVTLTNTWQRVSSIGPSIAGATNYSFGLRGSFGSSNSADCLIWGTQLEQNSVVTSYHAVDVVANDYNSYGFPVGLEFDGVTDFLSTVSTVNFNTNKLTLWTGVKKFSDVAIGRVVELTATTATDGSFGVAAPFIAATADYGFQTRGTVTTLSSDITGFAAPVTSTLCCQYDNSGSGTGASAQIRPRINGTAYPGVSATSAGNYANSTLYIGRRGGTTQPFSGRVYSLIIRAGTATELQLVTGEVYVTSKSV